MKVREVVTYKGYFDEFFKQQPQKVRQDLIATIESSECVILDFEGVNVVSNSFADECIAKLIPILGFNKLKQKTTFRNINDFARKNVLIALRRRLSIICSE